MRFLLPAAVLLLGLGGCAPEGKANGEAAAVAVEKVPIPVFEGLPAVREALKLVNEDREAHVGQDLADAELLVPRPKRAAEFRDLPPGFGAGFRSRGWEAEGEAYGIISYGGKVVSAVHSVSGVDEDRLSAILRRYRTASTMEPDVQGKSARYWFTTEDGVTLMVCAVADKEGLYVTEALGFTKAMEALRMSKLQAENDVRKADKGPTTKAEAE